MYKRTQMKQEARNRRDEAVISEAFDLWSIMSYLWS